MAIISIKTIQTGLVGVLPSVAYINTSDTLAKIQSVGYLNTIIKSGGASFQLPCMAAVSTKESPNSQPVTGWFAVTKSGDNWLLTPSSSTSGGVVLPTTIGNIATYTTTTGVIGQDAGVALNNGDIQAGGKDVPTGLPGKFVSSSGNPAHGTFSFQASPSLGPANITVTNADHNQSSTYTVPDTGESTAKFLMDEGQNDKAYIKKLSYGATPLPFIDPQSCTIQIVAGPTNGALIAIQMKDGSGANVGANIPYYIYASKNANGMLIADPASTGFSLSGGGIVLPNGSPVTTQIRGITADTGQTTLLLTDTAKQASWIVLVLANGIKISAQMNTGSYG